MKLKDLLLYLLVIFCIFTFFAEVCRAQVDVDTGGEEGEDGEEEEEGPGTYWHGLSFNTHSAVLVLLTILIALSWIFEIVKDKLEEVSNEVTKPIIISLWKELTILGLLSVIAFVIVKAGALGRISVHVFGEREEELLGEVLERVHMILFLVMVIFIIQVLLLGRIASHEYHAWKRAEHLAFNPQAVYEKHREYKLNPPKFWDIKGRYKKAQVVHDVQFLQVRSEFLFPREIGSAPLPNSFDLSVYFSKILGHTMSEVIEVGSFTRVSVEVLFICFWLLSGLEMPIQLGLFLLWAWCILVILIVVRWKLKAVRKQLLVPVPKANEYRALSTMLMTDLPGMSPRGRKPPPPVELVEVLNPEEDGSEGKNKEPVESLSVGNSRAKLNRSEADIHMETQSKKVPPYLANPKGQKPRSRVGKVVLGAPPNKHQSLFWFDKKGPKFVLNILRTVTLMIAIYLALFCFQYCPKIFDRWPVWAGILLVIAALIPVALASGYLTPSIIRNYVIVCNIEMLKEKTVIEKVIRMGKTKRAVRILKLLHFLQMRVAKVHIPVDEEMAKPKKDLTPKQKKEIHEVFMLFDEDGNGEISEKEFKHFLNALGHPTTPEERKQMMMAIDTDKNGGLSEEEFVNFMATQQQSDHKESVEETAAALFAIFDKDKSGTITPAELKETLVKLGTTLTEDDLHDFVKDFDQDGGGQIDLEEFTKVIKTHMKD